MENKGEIRLSLGMVISVMIIIALLVVGGYALYTNNLEIIELKETISEQKIELEKIEIEQKNEEIANNDDKGTENQIQTEETEFTMPNFYTATPKKVAENMIYDINDIGKGGFYIRIDNGKTSVYTDLEKDVCAQMAGVEPEQVKIDNRGVDITGFTKKVIDVHIGVMGQNEIYDFIFLMEDGTVEYSTVKNLVTNVSTQGKIEGLENIVRIQDVSVSDIPNESGYAGGYSSIIAIDKDNNYYDIAECIK